MHSIKTTFTNGSSQVMSQEDYNSSLSLANSEIENVKALIKAVKDKKHTNIPNEDETLLKLALAHLEKLEVFTCKHIHVVCLH